MIKFIFGIVCLFFVTRVASGQSTAGSDPRVDSVLEVIRLKHHIPALGGAIISGDTVTIGARGVRKQGGTIPATMRDQWHLGSDTKAMTATLIAALVEEGAMSWQSSVESVFPDIAPTLPENFRKVTVLQLLTHRAGLPPNMNWTALGAKGDVREQRIAALKAVSTVKLASTPGTAFLYSNWGYVLAGAMAEKIKKSTWEKLIAAYVFTPLGMKRAGFGGTGTPGKVDQPWGHGADGKPVGVNGPMMDNAEVMGPAGRVHCTLTDWAAFISDQLRGARGEPALLKAASYKILHAAPSGGEYACGWLVMQRDWAGGTALTHAGSNTMNYAVAWLAPQRNVAVLVCANQGGPAATAACDEAASALLQLHLTK
ncbi:MAG: beta-lactamase family protein [Ignavibacteria bacterium]|nr:beta-lactamase family protein [Ignavibacteria bacterium]